MGQINDCIHTALGPGHINDLLVDCYQTNGATSDDRNDAEREFLVVQGAAAASLEDMWMEFYDAQLITGALADRHYTFWCTNGGVIS